MAGGPGVRIYALEVRQQSDVRSGAAT